MLLAAAFGLPLAPPMSAGASPRERLRFDADWRFLRGPLATGPSRSRFAWSWKPASGVNLNLQALPADLSAGDWKPAAIGENVFAPAKGRFAWFRTELGSDPQGAAKRLTFESVDDNALVFLNGRRLAVHRGYGTPFDVPVAGAWRTDGPNDLVVLIENTDGPGGIDGAVDLASPESEAPPAEMARDFDDRNWRTVHLPHDYVVEGTFDPKGDTGHGSLPKPLGFYRKTFVPPASMRGKTVWIDFDGVYRNAAFYLNGHLLGRHSSGYIGVRYDLTKLLDWSGPNVLAVRVDPRQNEGWWYEGGGIYRHVWLNAAAPAHVAPDGTFARASLEHGRAKVRITTSVANTGAAGQILALHSRILDPKGRLVGTLDNKAFSVPPGGKTQVDGTLEFDKPQLWDLQKPVLYRVETTILRNGETVDAQTVSFGIRDVRWDKDRGVLLNGKVVKLQGTCNHQDFAGTGIAMPDGLLEWRIRQLKAMGSNAYRTSHNPVAPELLDACDRLGMLVLDETRHLGDATTPKTGHGTTANDLSELKAMVARDRNHPCVMAWSLYNEEPLQASSEGTAIFKAMRDEVNELDGTRLCTGAQNFGYVGGMLDVTDLFGFNYNIREYDGVHKAHPNLPLFGSETASALSTRGIYANDPVRGYVSAFDVNAPGWGATAEAAWRPLAERSWMAGGFVWTGFDYKGEPTPYAWPCINSHFGIMDICGFPKDTYWYYKSWWGDAPVVHLLPHWNWEGGTIKVWAHSNADRVELLLNGRSLGSKDVPKWGHVEFDVPYAPGTLEAKGYRGSSVVASDRVETTGAPAAIRLTTDRTKLLADAEDLSVVKVEIVDAQGRVVPTAGNEVQFMIDGAGEIGGVGNGDPSDHDPDKADHRKAFNGLCMALVKSNGKSGPVILRATSPGLKGARLTFEAAP